MGWIDYYTLLERYGGDLRKASAQELLRAAQANPNDPRSARRLAEQKWHEEHGTTEAEKRSNDAS